MSSARAVTSFGELRVQRAERVNENEARFFMKSSPEGDRSRCVSRRSTTVSVMNEWDAATRGRRAPSPPGSPLPPGRAGAKAATEADMVMIVSVGRLIQTSFGTDGGVGGPLTNRSGCSAYAASRVQRRTRSISR